ncbi:hypothetical protein KRX19_05615 [Cardiobacteriaceae bacterium TAE3-ERU3]|nr:hypothetical protein [Cardiobacteriaceae bacterium TAE3-ERU3]
MPKTENRMSIGNWITIAVAVFGFIVSGVANYYAGENDRALIRQQMDIMQAEYRAMILREENERKAADARIEQYNNAQMQMFRSDMRDMSAKVDKIYDIVAGVKGR